MSWPMRGIFLALTLLAGVSASAQTRTAARIEAELQAALGTPEKQTTQGAVQAYDQAARAYAREIRRVYEVLRKGLPEPQKRALERSQAAWLTYLDGERLVISYIHDAPGTLHRIMGRASLKSLLQHRLEEMCGLFLQAGTEDEFSEEVPARDWWCSETHRQSPRKDPLSDLAGGK